MPLTCSCTLFPPWTASTVGLRKHCDTVVMCLELVVVMVLGRMVEGRTIDGKITRAVRRRESVGIIVAGWWKWL